MKKTSSRFLEKEWEVARFDKLSGNVLRDLSTYLRTFNEDLLSIKKYNEQEFNTLSPVSIDEYIEMFYQRVERLFDIILSNKAFSDNYQNDISENLEKMKYMKNLNVNSFEILEEDYYKGTYIPRVCTFKDSVYPNAKSLAEQIFELEEIMSKSTKKMWKDKVIDNIYDYDKDKEYGLFVKVLIDWRKDDKDDPEIVKYLQNRLGISASYITNQKTGLFSQEVTYTSEKIGLVFSSKGFLFAKKSDCYTDEYIDDKCPLQSKIKYSKVMRIEHKGNHDIYSEASKICSPQQALSFDDISGYNEVVLDKRFSKPIAVFRINNKEKPLPTDSFIVQESNKLAHKFHLPIIEIKYDEIEKTIIPEEEYN